MKLLKQIIVRIPLFALLIQLYYLVKVYGFAKSVWRQKPIDSKKKLIPWFTYSAIEWLNQFDFSKKNFFEYGSGNSTIYWSERVKNITSLESDKKWYDEIEKKMPSNVKLVLKENDDDFYDFIDTENTKYDVIIIDSAWDNGKSIRENLVKKAINNISDNGMIIFDDTDFACKNWFPRKDLRHEACKFLRDGGFIQIDFAGFRPINPGIFCTSVFLTKKFDFSSLTDKQPTLKWI